MHEFDRRRCGSLPQAIATAFALAFFLLVLPARADSPAAGTDGGDRQQIEGVLEQLRTAIQAKDLDAIQRLYLFSDSTAAADKRREYEATTGLDTLSCAIT